MIEKSAMSALQSGVLSYVLLTSPAIKEFQSDQEPCAKNQNLQSCCAKRTLNSLNMTMQLH